MKSILLTIAITASAFSYATWLHPENILAVNNNYILEVFYTSDMSDSQSFVIERDSLSKSYSWQSEYHGEIYYRKHVSIYAPNNVWQKEFVVDYSIDSINGDTIMEYELISKSDTMQTVYEYSGSDTTILFQKFENGKLVSSKDTSANSYWRYIYDTNGFLDSAQVYYPSADSIGWVRWYDFEDGKLVQFGNNGNPEDMEETHRIMTYDGDKLASAVHMNLTDTVYISYYRYNNDVSTSYVNKGNFINKNFHISVSDNIAIKGDQFKNVKIYNVKGVLIHSFSRPVSSSEFEIRNVLPRGMFFISIDGVNYKVINR